jgi:predicted O-methyltransferase YrrM
MPGTKSKKVVETKAETPVKAKKEKAIKTEYVYALEPLPEKVLPPTEFSSESQVGVFIGQLIKMSKYRTAIEIGVFKGESSIKIIESLPNGGQYVGIDIGDYRDAEAEKVMQQGGKSIEFIINDSLSELPKLPKAHFDLIFVDGNHTWDYILKEFKIVETLVARGGVIVYHDSIKIDDVAQLVKYAQQFKYKAVTLNTPDGHGLSIIQNY